MRRSPEALCLRDLGRLIDELAQSAWARAAESDDAFERGLMTQQAAAFGLSLLKSACRTI